MGKIDNITKILFIVSTIKNLKHQQNQVEYKDSSNSYEMEARPYKF